MKTLNHPVESVKMSELSKTTKWSRFKDIASKYGDAAAYSTIYVAGTTYDIASSISKHSAKTDVIPNGQIGFLAAGSAIVSVMMEMIGKEFGFSKNERATVKGVTAAAFLTASAMTIINQIPVAQAAICMGLASAISYVPLKKVIENSALTLQQKAQAIGSGVMLWSGVAVVGLGLRHGGMLDAIGVQVHTTLGNFASMFMDVGIVATGVGIAAMAWKIANNAISSKKQGETQ